MTDEEIEKFVAEVNEMASKSGNGVAYEWGILCQGKGAELIIASHRILAKEILDSIPLMRESLDQAR